VTTAVITGSASGIGRAIRGRLEAEGHRVIGIDLRDAEIEVDLSRPEGRQGAVEAVADRCSGQLDRLILCAGVGTTTRPLSLVASVNYFGTIEVLDGLFPLLQRGSQPIAIAMASNSAQMAPFDNTPYVKALLDQDEAQARRLADEEGNAFLAYAGSKMALGKAIRRRAGEWGRAGVRLNAVAPGPVETPLLERDAADPQIGEQIRNLRIPLGRFGAPEEVASLVAFLVGPEAHYIHGAIYYIDGGIDAELRPDRF
jgi:NAD(P)-dependent dehydrogenase (short-subunit alcohol dehydrogenase family)